MRTILKNGQIINGDGSVPFYADVLIEDDKIVKVGNDLNITADKIIDCTNRYVVPGFIDAHSHNDFFIERDNSLRFFEPFIKQGITTQITGNCGFSPFGIDEMSEYKDKVGGGLFNAVAPTTFKEFCKNIEGKLYVNIIPLIGHGTTRISISGYKSADLSQEQLNQEIMLVDEAMRNGAFGGSLGLMYEPGMYSKYDELLAFAKKIKEYNGILTVHPRACSKVSLGYPLISKPHIEIAFDEVEKIMKETNVRMVYSHLIFVGKTTWKSKDKMLAKFKQLKADGYDIGYDNYSFTYGASVITVVLPPWYLALSVEKRKKPLNMLKLKLMTYITKKVLGLDFCDFTVAYIGDDYKQYEGKTVSQLAKDEGLKEIDMYLKLVDLSNGKGRIYLDKYYNEEIIKHLMKDENSVFMTDAWVEESGTQNGSTYQCFPNFIKKSVDYNFPIEGIINKMTGAIADRYKIKDRGKIKEGNFADITIFNMNNIKVDITKPDFSPQGIDYVIINGQLVLENNIIIDACNGKLIKRQDS